VPKSPLATVDRHGELQLTALQHPVPWLKGRERVECVVEVLQHGLVYVMPLEAWAVGENMTVEQAADRLRCAEADASEEDDIRIFLRSADRKKRRGSPLHEIRLPHMALYALFNQGEGPLAVRKGRARGDSGTVLVIIREAHVELWGQSFL